MLLTCGHPCGQDDEAGQGDGDEVGLSELGRDPPIEDPDDSSTPRKPLSRFTLSSALFSPPQL